MGADWQTPAALPDLRRVGIVALDTETNDEGLRADRGSGWPWKAGYVCGISVAYRVEDDIRAHYIPIRHPDSANLDREQVISWLKDLILAGVRFVTHNGLYDWGWLHADLGVLMPLSDQLEETLAIATLIDENRFSYSLENLCSWRGLPGKDEALLIEAVKALGEKKLSKKNSPQSHIWRLPARLVGAYAEADAANTLRLYENLRPILDLERTCDAYRLECDLLPMVHEMRRRGVRINISAAKQARDYCWHKRDRALAELSQQLAKPTGMEEIASKKWLVRTFDAHSISYPRTAKGNPSFKGGKLGWMATHPHWLPQLITTANKYEHAGSTFLEGHILNHLIGDRIYSEINPHRSEEGGTKSFRFSYAHPPLQQMPSRDPELGPLIRGVFQPDVGEVWATCDASQQEFRLLVHYAGEHHLRGAKEATALYCSDPNADFHAYVMQLTGLQRSFAKTVNFGHIYGMGVRALAATLGVSQSKAQEIYDQYDRELQFAKGLAKVIERRAELDGYTLLYGGYRRHWETWVPKGRGWFGANPCSREEADRRRKDPSHPWFGCQVKRADTRTALNALIQGSAAVHTKLWMRECWRRGITPLLQLHDSLELSVASPKQAERVAQLGCEVITLAVPMRVGLKFGRTWGDAKQTWAELAGTAPPQTAEPVAPEEPKKDSPAQEPPRKAPFNLEADAQQPNAGATPPAAGTYTYRNSGDQDSDDYASGEREWGRNGNEYIYRDANGAPYLRVVRTSAKQFPQYHWENGRWVKGKPAGPKIPYRLPELLAAAPAVPVFVCEGEKDADNVAALGLIATTNSEGAGKGKWKEELNRWFVGKGTVYVLEDNDADGRRHAGEVADALRSIVTGICIVSFPELPPKGDVSDWLAIGGTREQLLERARTAPRSLPNGFIYVRASDIIPRPIDWLWAGHLALGSQELLTGVPGTGKSQIHAALVAYVTTGGTWPDGCNGLAAGNCIMLTAEDCADQTVVPRLIAAGADRERVFILRKIRKDNKERMFLLGEDLEQLERMIHDIGDVRLITIDPITAYMGSKVDSHRATDVRGQLGPLAELAERKDVALSCITHPAKHSSQRAIDHFLGSQAFIAAARIGHMAIEEMDEDAETGERQPTGRILFTNAKNNLNAKMSTLAYRIAEKRLDGCIPAPYVVWEELVDITADQAVAAAAPSKAKEQSGPVVFLQDILTNGPVLVTAVLERGAARGFSKDQLKRARQRLKIVPFHETTVPGRWFWALPQHAPLPKEQNPKE